MNAVLSTMKRSLLVILLLIIILIPVLLLYFNKPLSIKPKYLSYMTDERLCLEKDLMNDQCQTNYSSITQMDKSIVFSAKLLPDAQKFRVTVQYNQGIVFQKQFVVSSEEDFALVINRNNSSGWLLGDYMIIVETLDDQNFEYHIPFKVLSE